jgi:hypothetical protein
MLGSALKSCKSLGKSRSTAREEADNSPLFQPWSEAVEDRSRGKSAGAFSQLRMDTDASREGVPEEFTGAEETQAERAVAGAFKGSK